MTFWRLVLLPVTGPFPTQACRPYYLTKVPWLESTGADQEYGVDVRAQASVRCLASYGALLEIGKYDILKGTGLSMRPMLRNIEFQGIDLDRVFHDGEALHQARAPHILKASLPFLNSFCCGHTPGAYCQLQAVSPVAG